MATNAGHAAGLALLSQGVGAAIVVAIQKTSGKSRIEEEFFPEFQRPGIVGKSICRILPGWRQNLR